MQLKSRSSSHLIYFAAAVAIALLIPAFASAAWNSLFRTFQTLPQGKNGVGIADASATGDFNGDGRPDIVLANQSNFYYGPANYVSVFLHNDRTVGPPYDPCTTFTVTGSDAFPARLAVADVNGDGNKDIVTGNVANDHTGWVSVSVIYGGGTGFFTKLRIKPLVNYAGGLAVGDLNNDGRADVACVVYTTVGNEGVAVMYATPDSLADAVIYGSSAGLVGVGIGDATGDGIPDLILQYSSSTKILKGDNAGNFSPGPPSLPASGEFVSMARVNGDAVLDIVQSNYRDAIIQMGDGLGGYQAPVTVPMFDQGGGTQSQTLLTGDVDGDGDTDLIAYLDPPGDVSVRKNDGTGSFGPATHYMFLRGACIPSLVDVDQDSRPDIVAGESQAMYPLDQPGSVAFLLNDGSGGFQSLRGVSGDSLGGAFGDFNRDGKPDLAYPSGSNAINIWFGNGDGTFNFHNSVPTPLSPSAMTAADINRDGKLDLLVEQSQNLVIYLGAGDGNFSASQTLTGASPSLKYLADLNRDGRPDLILLTSSGLKVCLQLSDGSYGTFTTYNTSGLSGADFGDWNRDGNTDIAVAGSNGLTIYTGSTTGTLTLNTGAFVSSASYSDVCVVDANRDGKPDLAARLTGDEFDSGIVVFLGNGNGTFGVPTALETIATHGETIDSWDVNRDGNPDLLARGRSGSDQLEVFLGGGNGAFGLRTSYGLGATSAHPSYGDVNGDAMPDIAVGTFFATPDQTSLVTILATPPTKPATLREASSYSTINFPSSVAVGDLNRDGKLDVVAGSSSSTPGIAVLLGNGDGTLGASTTLTQSGYGSKVALADFTGDGILDIVALDVGTPQNLAIFAGMGDGTFGTPRTFRVNDVKDFEIGDMNRDGIPDVVAATSTDVLVLLADRNGALHGGSSVSLGGATVTDLDLADMDHDGDLDVVVAAGAAKIIYTSGLGILGPVTNLPPPATNCRNVAIADINRDGAPDIIAQDGNTYYVIWGSLTGTPTTYTTQTLPFDALDMKFGEATSDGKPYLYLTRNSQGLDVYGVSPNGALGPIDSHIVSSAPNMMALADMDRDGQVDVVSVGSASNLVTVNLHSQSSAITAVDTPASTPAAPRVALRQNYPNPFNPRTTIRYSLARPERVKLSVFDVRGRLITTLRDGSEPAGERSIEWDGRDREGQPVASGVYLYRLTSESGEDCSKRMVVVK